MLQKTMLVALVCPMILTGCATPETSNTSTPMAQTVLLDTSGKRLGEARITAMGDDVELVAQVSGMAAGAHGIHVHTTGKCDGPGFTTAGGHLNPSAHQHGTMNPAGPHMGDLPNIMVGPDGTGSIRTTLTGLPADLGAAMFDADGSAVVVHAGPDDYKTDPAGNSGGRIACGILSRSAG